jgi:cyclic dehypoxanthinyl futalosine synthase
MMYGHVETSVEIVEHLLKLRDLQARTGGFYAFIPWSYKPAGNRLGKTVTQTASEAMYLRIIALSRLILDNFPHIQASWFSEGRKTGQLALTFGADDFGGTLLEEHVLRGTNDLAHTTLEEVLHLIHDAGYIPVQRDTLYQTLTIYEEPKYFKNRLLSPYAELMN